MVGRWIDDRQWAKADVNREQYTRHISRSLKSIFQGRKKMYLYD